MAKLDSTHHAHLIAYFWCSQFNDPKRIHFVVDSGCSTTTILNDDATLLGVDCSELNLASAVSTANGQVTPYEIPEAILIYKAMYGPFNLLHGVKGSTLTKVHCHVPTNPQLLTQQRIDNAFSLLGMDYLQRFKTWKWDYKGGRLFLITYRFITRGSDK